MTNELIKVLMLFSLYAVLETALFSPSIGRLVCRAVRSSERREAHHKSAGRVRRGRDTRPAE
jgi:hypothetical protein